MAIQEIDADGLVDVLNKGLDGVVTLKGEFEMAVGQMKLHYRGKAMIGNSLEGGIELSFNGTTASGMPLPKDSPLHVATRLNDHVFYALNNGWLKINSPEGARYISRD